MKENHGNTSSKSDLMTLLFCILEGSEHFGKVTKESHFQFGSFDVDGFQ